MLERLTAARLITPPAIWGKLPAHPDFVRSGVRHGEGEGWQSWLTEQGAAAALPIAFVLPPGALAFAPRRHVVGVIKASSDKVGRRHPLIVYQVAHTRWVARHFEMQARQPTDWLFWLTRAVARHAAMQGEGGLQALEQSVHELWKLHAPSWPDLWRSGGRPTPPQAELGAIARIDPAEDPARELLGVRHLPWADWPQRLQRRGTSAFWQQDAHGGFVDAAHRLDKLWSVSS